MEKKNFLLAMGLIVSFLLIWSIFVVPKFTPPQQPPAQPTDSAKPMASSSPVPQAAPTAPLRADEGRPVVAEEAMLRDANNEIVMTPYGGAIRHWGLKGRNVELVLDPENPILPLASFPETVFKITVQNAQAVMRATLPSGVRVTKTLALNPTGHLHTISYRFENPTSRAVDLKKWSWGWGPGLGTTQDEMKENPSLIRAITLGKLKVHVIKPAEHPEMGRWAAIDNRYYLVAFIPKTEHPVELASEGKKEHARLTLLETTLLPPNGTAVLDYELYVGPKGYTALKKYDRNLEESVDFGMFTGLGRFILNVLNRLKSWSGNYGIAIILLTIGLQVLLFPLTIKSFKATMAMKKLQPKIAELQVRFKGDPKRLNVEMMNLYKSSGTNPFGGCLPMLLQLPIFWALFTTLRNAYELRGAAFIGWMTDLSTPDVLMQIAGFPLHALPLIMGGAMFFQQRMAGAPSDPMQKQMMTMMPIMFTFMFYSFPSGLVLYWLTNNIMTMAFQWSFQRFTEQPPSGVIDTKIVK